MIRNENELQTITRFDSISLEHDLSKRARMVVPKLIRVSQSPNSRLRQGRKQTAKEEEEKLVFLVFS
jgi:hypothetical protein